VKANTDSSAAFMSETQRNGLMVYGRTFVFRRVRKIAKIIMSVRPSACPSVRLSAWNISVSTGRILIEVYV
jgi:hypothetical protein